MHNVLPYSPIETSYSEVYEDLSNMRELFHQTGRFDDSNAKLDEVAKLFATYIAFKRKMISEFPKATAGSQSIVSDLRIAFAEAVHLNCYQAHDGSSIFGVGPMLSLRDSDSDLARALVKMVRHAVDAALNNRNLNHPFDVLNEAFGHFVRDNFRGNTEDAQYLTPPEVVQFMVDMALNDISKLPLNSTPEEPLVVMDPAAGVGSFLTLFHQYCSGVSCSHSIPHRLVAQDKVDRMVRLSKINFELFETSNGVVTIGNSLEDSSPLSLWNGKVDLVLTNPPFGATFSGMQISEFGKRSLPIFAPLASKVSRVATELLFVDRALCLLKDNGLLLIVVPDKVISAKGIAALLRQKIQAHASVRAIIELPSVTFAQAGTRTKTCILYLRKCRDASPQEEVFLATSENLGFEVSSRKGVQVKNQRGVNDLPRILDAYRQFQTGEGSVTQRVFCDKPSCVSLPSEELISGSWTPSHYRASRMRSLASIRNLPEATPTPLLELVDLQSEKRKTEPWSEEHFFISVLHILGEGLLDFNSIVQYHPKTPGLPTKKGEIILSKINPRIPRVLVLPDLKRRILCSTEFEIMSPKSGVDPYFVAYMLLSHDVQEQIKSLTSGTSASHNRIKTESLRKVLIPVPKLGSAQEDKLAATVSEYKRLVQGLYGFASELSALRRKD